MNRTNTTYSVLLLYPDQGFSTPETYYTSIEAPSPDDALDEARMQAADDNVGMAPEDFTPLLVIEGEHDDLMVR